MPLPTPVTGPTPVPPVPPPSVVLDPPPQEANIRAERRAKAIRGPFFRLGRTMSIPPFAAILIPFSSQSRPASSSFLSSSRSRPHGHRFFVPVPFDCVPGNLLIRWSDTRRVRAAERVRKPALLLRPAPRFLPRDPAGVDRLDPPGVDGDREGRPDGDRHLLPRRAAVHDQVPLVSVDGPVRSPVPRLGPGAGVHILGYRVAMLTSGAIALILADRMPWHIVYLLMAGSLLVGMTASLLSPEPEIPGKPPRTLKEAVVEPFLEFFARPGAAGILLFIVFYKLDVVMAVALTTPFLLELGFTKTDIGAVTKGLGRIATLAGPLAAGAAVARG